MTCPDISISEIEVDKKPFAMGGFDEIYKAMWRKQDVVVKVIEALAHEQKENVKQEANITLLLNHPNVVKVFGITCVEQWKMGIVMELAEHGSLDMWIGKIAHDKLTKIALGIVDGLEYVHSQHVIHRDIKPKTILLFGPVDDMIPKISDFGMSKVIRTAKTVHTKAGQLLYMAPEVAMHFPYSFTADIFSLAITLFEMFNEELLQHASIEVRRFIVGIHLEGIIHFPESCKVPVYLRNVIKCGCNNVPDERPKLSEYRSALRGKYTLFSRELYLRICGKSCLRIK